MRRLKNARSAGLRARSASPPGKNVEQPHAPTSKGGNGHLHSQCALAGSAQKPEQWQRSDFGGEDLPRALRTRRSALPERGPPSPQRVDTRASGGVLYAAPEECGYLLLGDVARRRKRGERVSRGRRRRSVETAADPEVRAPNSPLSTRHTFRLHRLSAPFGLIS